MHDPEAAYPIVLIALFGAAGAVSRYAVSGWLYSLLGESFPYGTLAVNLIGCFLLGAVMHFGQVSELLPPMYRQAVTVGMLGAFTTFSTFGYETLQQFQTSQWRLGLVNIATNVVIGLFAVWCGMAVSRQIFGGG